MTWLIDALRHHPELALFLTLGIGYALGNMRLAGQPLGAVTGVLIAGVVIGQLGIKLSDDLKSAFFLLFLFSIGYKTGPQFFRGLKASGLSQAALTVILCGTGLAVAYLMARVFGFDAGTAAGLLAGSLTESATIGTAGDAIGKLPLDEAARQQLLTNATVGFAVTYFLGVILTAAFLSRVGPKLMRVDLAAECKQLEQEMGAVEHDAAVVSAYYEFIMRAYRVPDSLDGKSVSELEKIFQPQHRVFVERLRTAGTVVGVTPDTRLHAGDQIVLAGAHEALVLALNPLLHEEIEDRELLDIAMLNADVVLTNKAYIGHTLGELDRAVGARGLFLRKLTRGTEELPFTLRTALDRGDVLTLVGAQPHVERAAQNLGFIDRPTSATDMVVVAAAIVLGGLVGLPAFAWGKLDVGLSLPVGVLMGGLVFGWLRSVTPRFGRVPPGALWFFDSVGLTAFLAVVALSAGPSFVKGLQESGLSIVIACFVVTLTPHVVTILIGRHVFKVHPGVLLGICAGAGTSAPALAAIQEVAKSKIPTLGYGVPYAVGNVLLALWGSVMVALMSA